MAGILTRIQFDLDGISGWSDAPAGRVNGNVSVVEGRATGSLGGPTTQARTSAITMQLLNDDGYFTHGAGSDLGPGSLVRIQWRAATGDPWVTRFQGRLSELTSQFENNFPYFATRWVGPLYRFTAGNIPSRLLLNNTPQQIMTVLCDAAGIAATERDFDTDTEEYNRQLSAGYAGVNEVANMLDAFIYDTPDYKVRLELPATRAAKSIVARYTDAAPDANEIAVPPPRRLTRPFGIINHVDGEYHYYTPMSSTASEINITSSTRNFNTPNGPHSAPIVQTITLDATPSGNIAISDFTLEITDRVNNAYDMTVSHPDTSGSVTVSGRTVFVDNVAVVIIGNTVCASFSIRTDAIELRNRPMSSDWSITLTDTVSFEQSVNVFQRSVDDTDSINSYGYRPRPLPIVIGLFQATPLADDFTPDYADLDAAIQQELAAYAEPIPVFTVQRQTGNMAERDDILARRLSDKVRLTADGPSQLHAAGVGVDFFVEAIETTLTAFGDVRQTLWLEAAPPPEPPDAAPSGFTVTRDSETQATLTWNAGTPRAARYNVYRGTDSGTLTLLAGDLGDETTVEYIDDTIMADDYWYAVAAANDGGDGPQTVAMRAPWPAMPTGFAVLRISNTQLFLHWTNPNDPLIIGYRIRRALDTGPFNLIETHFGNAGTTQYTDSTVIDNQLYHYQVAALHQGPGSDVFEGPFSDIASGTP